MFGNQILFDNSGYINLLHCIPALAAKPFQHNHFLSLAEIMNQERTFVQRLLGIGERLRRIPSKDARRTQLFGELARVNLDLPSRTYLPLSIGGSNDLGTSSGEEIALPLQRDDGRSQWRSHHVVRIPPSEAVVLNSKDRAPYMLQVEVVDCKDFFRSPVPQKQQVRGHMRSRSDGASIHKLQTSLIRTRSETTLKEDFSQCKPLCREENEVISLKSQNHRASGLRVGTPASPPVEMSRRQLSPIDHDTKRKTAAAEFQFDGATSPLSTRLDSSSEDISKQQWCHLDENISVSDEKLDTNSCWDSMHSRNHSEIFYYSSDSRRSSQSAHANYIYSAHEIEEAIDVKQENKPSHTQIEGKMCPKFCQEDTLLTTKSPPAALTNKLSERTQLHAPLALRNGVMNVEALDKSGSISKGAVTVCSIRQRLQDAAHSPDLQVFILKVLFFLFIKSNL